MVNNQPFREMLTKNKNEANVIFTGFAFDKGASCGSGAKDAPKKFLELSGFLPSTTKDGEVIDKLKIYNNGILEECDDYLKKAEKIACDALKLNKFNLFYGGDHSIAIATEAAFYDYAKSVGKHPVIIHLDAHPDYCDEYDGSKFSHACPNARSIDKGFGLQDITLIGIRGFEEQEVKLFNNHPEIPLYTAKFVKEHGVKKVIKEICGKYSDCLVHISFDIDITDPGFAPGTGTPEAFGLSSDEVLELLTGLFNNLDVQSMDLVEVSPALDVNDITSWLSLKIMYELFNIINRRL